MKIIKHGERKDSTKRFKCPSCGCVFEANKNEYQTTNYRNEYNSYCVCPECGNDAPETLDSWRESNGLL